MNKNISKNCISKKIEAVINPDMIIDKLNAIKCPREISLKSALL